MYACAYMFWRAFFRVRVFPSVYMCVEMQGHMCVCTCVCGLCVGAHLCVRVCMCVSVSVCLASAYLILFRHVWGNNK